MTMSIPITDTHQHLVYPDKFPYSWAAEIPQLAGKNFRTEEYQNASEGTGINRTIFMEANPDDPHWLEETKFVYELSEKENSIIDGIIANCRPESEDDFAAYIESVMHPKLVGLRRVLHVVPDELSQPDRFAENIRLLEKYNLTFDLCFMARQLPLAYDLASKCPKVQFILNHCGVPDIAGAGLDPWRDHIKRLSELPNVACKISGVPAYCAPGDATAEAMRPYVGQCLEFFGWDRVVWGGDWPVCNTNSDLDTWVRVSRELVADATEADQHKLFHENAERIYLKK